MFSAEPQESLTACKRCWNSRSDWKRVKKLVQRKFPSGLFLRYHFHCRALQHTLDLFKLPVSHDSVEKSLKDLCLHPSYSAPSTLSFQISPNAFQFPFFFFHFMSVGINILDAFRTNTREMYSVLLNFVIVMVRSHV